ncbi:MAG: DUF952 domain-containing protein [Myxococcota bacterium]|nr:DUF952 domain-containing protein [Myxococcota bacterium]
MSANSIYRIVTEEELRTAKESGRVPRNSADESSGFVHLSPHSEVLTTASRYYSTYPVLYALEVSAEALGPDLKWEVVKSRKNVSFPHLYAPNIPWNSVREVHRLSINEQGAFDWR